MEQSPSHEVVKEFVIAAHGNLERVEQMLAMQPALLNVSHEWGPGDSESALEAAAHMGNRPIAEYLLDRGAPLAICTAAMLDRREDVEQFLLADAAAIRATGAHAIPLLTHAALSGDVELVRSLFQRGATAGASAALSEAVRRGNVELTRWLLENADPDLEWQDFQGKTVSEIATELGHAEIAELLRA